MKILYTTASKIRILVTYKTVREAKGQQRRSMATSCVH